MTRKKNVKAEKKSELRKDAESAARKIGSETKAMFNKAERKGELQKDAESMASKIGSGTKAMFNKIDESYSDLKEGYQKERDKHKTN